jgi:hypothetical protein
MSAIGLRKCAAIFEKMQLTRGELLQNHTDHQDVLLAQMLLTGKDAMKERFSECTMMPDATRRRKKK